MRIDKNQTKQILGMSEATLNRRLKIDIFRNSTGAAKMPGSTNDVWTFDEQLVRSFAAHAPARFDKNQQIEETGVIKGEIEPDFTEEISAAESTDLVRTVPEFSGNGLDIDRLGDRIGEKIGEALILRKKKFLNLREAAALSGLSRKYLHSISELIGGRRVVRRKTLDEL